MKRISLFRAAALLALLALVCTAATTLHVSARTQDRLADPTSKPRAAKLHSPGSPFVPCPWPSCMAPCVLGADPQGLCKAPDGSVTPTSKQI